MTDSPKTLQLPDAFILLTCQAWVVATFPIAVYLITDRTFGGSGAGLAAIIRAAFLGSLILIPLVIATLFAIRQQHGRAPKGKTATTIALQCALIMMVALEFVSPGVFF